MVWLDARGSFDRCYCPTRYILNVVNNNKSQVKRSVQLLPEEFGRLPKWSSSLKWPRKVHTTSNLLLLHVLCFLLLTCLRDSWLQFAQRCSRIEYDVHFVQDVLNSILRAYVARLTTASMFRLPTCMIVRLCVIRVVIFS